MQTQQKKDVFQCFIGLLIALWHRLLTVLPNVHADGFRRGDVGIRGPHGSTGIPHVEEEENGYRREAEDGEKGKSEDVGQEDELREREGVKVVSQFFQAKV